MWSYVLGFFVWPTAPRRCSNFLPSRPISHTIPSHRNTFHRHCDTMTSKTKSSTTSSPSKGPIISPITVGILVVGLSILIQFGQPPSITGPPHPNKPFSSFTQFYPFYKSEHSNEGERTWREMGECKEMIERVLIASGVTSHSEWLNITLTHTHGLIFFQLLPFFVSVNRQLHFAGTSLVILLFLINLRTLPSLLFAGSIGYILSPMLVGLSHGFFELAIVMGVFIMMNKISTGKVRN